MVENDIFKFDEVITSNNIPVFYKEMQPNSEKNDFMWCAVIIRAGAFFQSLDKRGLTHFFEHLVFANNDEKFISNILDNEDIFLNANICTDSELIYFYVKIKTKNLPIFFHIIRNAFLDFHISENFMKNSKEIIKNEVFCDKIDLKIKEFFESLLFQSIELENFNKKFLFSQNNIISGVVQEIDNLTIDDMKDYWVKYFHVGNVKFIYVGNMEIGDFLLNLENFFSDMKPREIINLLKNVDSVSYALKENELPINFEYIKNKNYFTHEELNILKSRLNSSINVDCYIIFSKKYLKIIQVVFYYLRERIYLKLREQLGLIYSVKASHTVMTDAILCLMIFKNVEGFCEKIKIVFKEELQKLKNNVKKIIYDHEVSGVSSLYREYDCWDIFDLGIKRIRFSDSANLSDFYFDVTVHNVLSFLEQEFLMERVLFIYDK